MVEDRLQIRTRQEPVTGFSLQPHIVHGETSILLADDGTVATWLKSRGFERIALMRLMGFIHKRKIIGAVGWYNYDPPDISIQIYTESPRWATKKTLFWMFHYPFEELGCTRITGVMDSNNKHGLNVALRLGWRVEGFKRKGAADGTDRTYIGMLKDECRWLNYERRS